MATPMSVTGRSPCRRARSMLASSLPPRTARIHATSNAESISVAQLSTATGHIVAVASPAPAARQSSSQVHAGVREIEGCVHGVHHSATLLRCFVSASTRRESSPYFKLAAVPWTEQRSMWLHPLAAPLQMSCTLI